MNTDIINYQTYIYVKMIYFHNTYSKERVINYGKKIKY